jgi:murein DD-endopeptidase MepM/ murein hydrolase activator NlpD
LYYELGFAATQLNTGYYGWRVGTLTVLQFHDQSRVRLSPKLNPGSVALQRLFGKLYDQGPWYAALYGEAGFLDLYRRMFGDPWERAARVEPLLPAGLTQPDLELPFLPGERWSFSGGPHLSWNTGTPRGGLDFAPVTGEAACVTSRAWATASAPGVVARSGYNVVVLDLDGDGFEQTGWVVLYLHLAEDTRAQAGERVGMDAQLGHPSCERGNSTGTHVHIARKYNGEWIAAAGPSPFVLSGWEVRMGERNYEGQLVKGDQVVAANPLGTQTTIIVR